MALRIRSGQKWPEKVVFDTTMPGIVPPPPPVVAMAAGVPAVPDKAEPAQTVASQLDARAEMKPAVQHASAPRRLARVHHHRTPQRGSTWVAANPPGWGSWNW